MDYIQRQYPKVLGCTIIRHISKRARNLGLNPCTGTTAREEFLQLSVEFQTSLAMALNTDVMARAFVISLEAHCNGKTTAEVIAITDFLKNAINDIYELAIAPRFDPNHNRKLLDVAFVFEI